MEGREQDFGQNHQTMNQNNLLTLVAGPYLKKHYSKYLTKLATKELMKFSKDIGLGGDIITDGKDFLIDEI